MCDGLPREKARLTGMHAQATIPRIRRRAYTPLCAFARDARHFLRACPPRASVSLLSAPLTNTDPPIRQSLARPQKMGPPCAHTPRGSGACLPLDAARVYLSSGALRSLTRSQDPEAKEGNARARSPWPIRVTSSLHLTGTRNTLPQPRASSSPRRGRAGGAQCPLSILPFVREWQRSRDGWEHCRSRAQDDPCSSLRGRAHPHPAAPRPSPELLPASHARKQEDAVLRTSACVRTEVPRASSLIGSCPGKKATMSAGTCGERPRR